MNRGRVPELFKGFCSYILLIQMIANNLQTGSCSGRIPQVHKIRSNSPKCIPSGLQAHRVHPAEYALTISSPIAFPSRWLRCRLVWDNALFGSTEKKQPDPVAPQRRQFKRLHFMPHCFKRKGHYPGVTNRRWKSEIDTVAMIHLRIVVKLKEDSPSSFRVWACQ